MGEDMQRRYYGITINNFQEILAGMLE